jgi:hypothetical protein
MRRDPGLEHLLQIGLKTRACPFLVGLAEAAIAGDVGDHHGGKPALHVPSPPGSEMPRMLRLPRMASRMGFVVPPLEGSRALRSTISAQCVIYSLQNASNVRRVFVPVCFRRGSGGLRLVGRCLTSWIGTRRTPLFASGGGESSMVPHGPGKMCALTSCTWGCSSDSEEKGHRY